MYFNEVGYRQVFIAQHTNAEHTPQKRAPGLCTGEASIGGRVSGLVSSPCSQGWVWPGLLWDFTCLSIQWPELCLMSAFHLAAFAHSWPVLKRLLAMAFFFSSTHRGSGWEKTATTLLALRPWLCRAVWAPVAGQKSWLPKSLSLSWPCCHCVTFTVVFHPGPDLSLPSGQLSYSFLKRLFHPLDSCPTFVTRS